jgi:hypothetical protein
MKIDPTIGLHRSPKKEVGAEALAKTDLILAVRDL